MGVPGLPNAELDGVRELLDELVMALEQESAPADAAHVELLALDLQAPFALPDAPPELARALPAALARRANPLAADLLVALERLAPEPLAGFASEERMRLERAGISAPHERRVGAATLAGAFVFPAPEGAGELWEAVLRRPGDEPSQTIVVVVEHEPCGAVIVDVVAAEPEDGSAAEALRRHVGDRPAEPLDAQELLHRLREALAHMERHDVALEGGAANALPLLERALTGRAGRLPRPEVEYGDEDAESYERADGLVEAFAEALERDEGAGPALRAEGPYVAYCMLDWKLAYADGDLGRWTLGDLRELLLEWLPRKLTAGGQVVEIAADAVTRFLRFLAHEDLLDAPVPLSSLEAAVERLRPRFERACSDPRRWGPAKALMAEMAADGVDLQDEPAVDTWIEGYNARPLESRTRHPHAATRTSERSARPHAERAAATAADDARGPTARTQGPLMGADRQRAPLVASSRRATGLVRVPSAGRCTLRTCVRK